MQLEKNKSLIQHNTFGFDSCAEYFVEANNLSDAQEAIDYCKTQNHSLTILGDGSNVVLTGDIPGVTLKMAASNFFLNDKDGGSAGDSNSEDTINVIAEAGVNWHQFVLATIERKAYGLENLSLIPGTVGAAPIQNIGAYGVEIASRLTFVECIDCGTNQLQVFDNAACEFAYRDSLFKRSKPLEITSAESKSSIYLPRFLITRVGFSLQREFNAEMSYSALSSELQKRGIEIPDAATVSEIVCQIRQSKLPDPATLGNAGSFFKNPVIGSSQKNDFQR